MSNNYFSKIGMRMNIMEEKVVRHIFVWWLVVVKKKS